MLITFSGLDGSGKTTLAAALAEDLRRHGHHTKILRMYDVAFYTYVRAPRDTVRRMAHTGRGLPPAKVQRGSGPVYDVARNITVRRMTYLADIASTLAHRALHQGTHGEVVVMDRYLYDLLVDISGAGWPSLGALMRLTPEPDVPVYVDVAPEQAFARKGEFDVSYLERRREIYDWIFKRLRNPVILENNDFATSRGAVLAAALARLE